MREKDLKSVKEGLGDLAAQAEMDHEIQMARSELYKIAKYAIKLHEMLKGRSEEQGLEAWQQSKITKAADYIGSVFHNLEYEMKFGAQMAESEKQKGVDGKACWDGYKRMGTKQKGGKTVDNCVKEDEYKLRLAQQLEEKAKSKAQQKFMGMVYATKKGEKAASPEVAKAAKGMSKSAAKDYASTKHKGKPEHVGESRLVESNEVNDYIDRVIAKRGVPTTIEEVEQDMNDTVKGIRDFLQSRDDDSFLQGFSRGFKRFAMSPDYIKRQFLGRVAERLDLPGLYSMPNGDSYVYVDKDQSGNYKSARYANIEDAVIIYKSGFITRKKAIELRDNNVNTALRNPKHPSSALYGDPGPAAGWAKTNPLVKPDGSTTTSGGAQVTPVKPDGSTTTSGGAQVTPVKPDGSTTTSGGLDRAGGSSYVGSVGTATNDPAAGSGTNTRGGRDPSAQFSRAITALAKANNIKNPNLIRVGQTIKLPGKTEPYTVVKGDTLSGIAAGKFKGTAPK